MRTTILVAAAALMSSASAGAIADPSGAYASGYATGVFQIGCTTCPHYVLTLDGDPAPVDGGPGSPEASILYNGGPDRTLSGVPNDYTLGGGAAMAATARFEGPLATPVLGARAHTENVFAYTLSINGALEVGVDYYGATAAARTVQRYAYSGAAASTYTFHFAVDGSIQDSRSGVFASAGFFDEILERNFAFGYFEAQGTGFGPTTQPAAGSFDVVMTFQPGDVYYLSTSLTAQVIGMYATGDVTTDALHTMRVTSVTGGDLGLLSAAVAAVPEPSAWALMLSGTLALGLAARRRRR